MQNKNSQQGRLKHEVKLHTKTSQADPLLSAQSQPFFQGYRSILPTSLAYFIPQTNGFEP